MNILKIDGQKRDRPLGTLNHQKKQYLKCYNKSKIIIKVKYTTKIKQKKLKISDKNSTIGD